MANPQSKQKIDRDKQRILTPEFRVSYPHIFAPSAFKNSKPKYSVTMLFPKTADLTPIKEAIKQAKLNTYGPKENWPESLESPVTDGDHPKHAGKDGYKGHWVIKASTDEQYKPGLVDQNVQPIINQSDFYAGCYARAYVYAFTWEFMGRDGISFILDHVQKTRDGEAFGGKKSAEAVFTPINSGPTNGAREEQDLEDFT